MAATWLFPQIALFARKSPATGGFRPLAIACFAILAIVASQSAQSDDLPTQVWVNPGFYSQHFKSSSNFRSDNWGVGAEMALSPEHAVLAGSFINSDGRRSQYGAYWWRPVYWKYNDVGVHAGVVAATLDGYPNYRNGGWFVAPIPAIAIEGGRVGANVMVVPTIKNRVQGAIAMQLKIRVW
jgi:hypothetical protein